MSTSFGQTLKNSMGDKVEEALTSDKEHQNSRILFNMTQNEFSNISQMFIKELRTKWPKEEY